MKTAIVTGACGFIGSCLTRRLCDSGMRVIGIDNLCRKGTDENAKELSQLDGFCLEEIDAADFDAVERVFSRAGDIGLVAHLAAQVAVTTSYIDPLTDFRRNAMASFNVIECARRHTPSAYCLYASTNKVYGHVAFASPVGLEAKFDPYTPYGVSKAVGELYFSEYGREEIGLRTVSFRQSCIYGHHQFGVEDQGWLAWFTIANMLDRPITIYGDGKQIRDLLFVDDLVDLYMEAWERDLRGVYPVGGGSNQAINLKDALSLIAETTGRPFSEIRAEGTRPGDQPYFVADTNWARASGLKWTPTTSIPVGLSKMVDWIAANVETIKKVLA